MVLKKNIFLIFFILIIYGPLIAGNTGKFAGRIIDKETGDPLIGANILIKGTHLGAASDENGEFYVLNVYPGRYDVVASYMGYHDLTITGVLIRVDLTTRINIKLESKVIESPTIVIIAERKMIQKDITSTRRITTREELIATPGLETTADVFKLRAGAVVDIVPERIELGEGSQLQLRDESLKNIHVRGGRGGEILFIVDGMPVTHPLYGGRDVLNLNVQEVEQVELLTGAFSAEYGQAQSGVINITTRSGGIKRTGGIEYKNDKNGLTGDSYNNDFVSFYLGGPFNLTQKLLPLIGLKIPGDMYYFASGNMNLNDTRLDNGRTRKYLFKSIGLKQRQDNELHLNTKLTWEITPRFSIIGSYNGNFKQWTNFEWYWIMNPDNTGQYLRNTNKLGLRINHVLSSKTFYNLNLGHLQVNYKASLDGHTKIPEYWNIVRNDTTNAIESVYSSLIRPVIDPATGFYTDKGFQDIWRDDLTKTFTFKFDLRSQINKTHLLKTGFQVQYNDIQYIDIQDGGYFLSKYGEYKYLGAEYFDPPPGPFKEFGRTRWVFDAYPYIGGFYLEDKIESEALIINAGIRVDGFLKGPTVMNKTWKQKWEDATGLAADWKNLNYKISPRFGISFPILEHTVLFFSYGHFNQLPELQYYYRDPYTGGFTGNPGLDYEQTILYEFGFTHRLANDYAIDIKSFQRDISKQVGTQQLLAHLGLPVSLYDNRGYARARGIEIELNKRYSNFTSGHIAYTVQWATGYSSSSFSDYIESKSDIPNPIRERRLNWDTRHQVVANITFQSPKGQHLNLFGFKLPDNWAITSLIRFASGRPYTPGTYDPIEASLLQNSETLPWTLGMDIRMQKTFNIVGLNFDLFADIYNLLNRTNSRKVNPWTGEPYKYGDVIGGSKQYYNWRQMILRMNPQQIADPLYAIAGLRIRF